LKIISYYIFHFHVQDRITFSKGQKNDFFLRKYQSLKRFNFYVQDETLIEDSIRRILFCEINLSNENKMLIYCKDFFCRRIRKWFSSAKILIDQKIFFLYKYFWRSVNQKNFLLWNKPFKMKTTCRKTPSAERQENDFFLWKYEILECFSYHIQDEILL